MIVLEPVVDRIGRDERRKHNRHRAKGNAFVEYGIESPKVGQVIDVSMGGLSFRYFVDGVPTEESFELTMYCVLNGFHLENAPVITVSDVSLPTFVFPKQRRRGVRFGNLTSKQKTQVKYFLKNHTRGTF